LLTCVSKCVSRDERNRSLPSASRTWTEDMYCGGMAMNWFFGRPAHDWFERREPKTPEFLIRKSKLFWARTTYSASRS